MKCLKVLILTILLSSCAQDKSASNKNLFRSVPNSFDSGTPEAVKNNDSFDDEISNSWSCIDTDNFDLNGNGDPGDDCDEAFSASDGKLSAKARGADIWGTTHQFQALYLQGESGDFDYSIKIESMQSTPNAWAKLGLFIANDISDLSMGGYVMCAQTVSNRVTMQHAVNDDQVINGNGTEGTNTTPKWLRLKKVGNDISCFYKEALTDSWTQHSIGTLTKAYAANFDVGIVLTSHNSAATLEVIYDDFEAVVE